MHHFPRSAVIIVCKDIYRILCEYCIFHSWHYTIYTKNMGLLFSLISAIQPLALKSFKKSFSCKQARMCNKLRQCSMKRVSQSKQKMFVHVNIQTVKHSKVVQSSSSEQEIDFHMCHLSTFWSGDLVSCQYPSDLHTGNMLYADQSKIIYVNNWSF